MIRRFLHTRRLSAVLTAAVILSMAGCALVKWDRQKYLIFYDEFSLDGETYGPLAEDYYGKYSTALISLQPTSYGTLGLSDKGPYRVMARFKAVDGSSFDRVVIDRLSIRYLSNGATSLLVSSPTTVVVEERSTTIIRALFSSERSIAPDFNEEKELIIEIEYTLLDDNGPTGEMRRELYKFIGKSSSGFTSVPWATA